MERTSPSLIKPPAIIAESPTIEPTDRSIPPLIITKVIPIASNAYCEACLVIINIFLTEKKLGTVKLKNKINTIKAIKVRILNRSIPSVKSLNEDFSFLSKLSFIVLYPLYEFLTECPIDEAFTSLSSVISSLLNSPVILPFDITKTLSDTAIICFNSEAT